jgi:hypothetical protein
MGDRLSGRRKISYARFFVFCAGGGGAGDFLSRHQGARSARECREETADNSLFKQLLPIVCHLAARYRMGTPRKSFPMSPRSTLALIALLSF